MIERIDFIKRDVSWLSFNYRVLQEAKDSTVPLYERIKFLAIYSSNLDEFFRVRVASLRSFKELKKQTRKEMDVKPKKELKLIRKIVDEQQKEFGEIFREQIIPELKSNGINLINEQQYDEKQQVFAKQYFFESIHPHIQLEWIKPEEGASPFLKNRGLYFIVQFNDSEDFALVNIPSEKVARFCSLPSSVSDQYYITFLDDLIRYNLDEIFQRPIAEAYSIKVSRDAEMYIEDEFSGDLLEKIKHGLDDRDVGLPTRFLFDASMPESLIDQIKTIFQLSKNDLIPGARYHNFNDFFGFPNPKDDSSLHDPAMPPLPHPVLNKATSIIETLQKQDVMLHFPYQKYDYVSKFIWEAADDPAVKEIKITLYRVASKSAVVQAMLHAREKGKAVFAFIEAKARFDEESNLYWGDQLAQAGATVNYSYPGIKVHTKLLLVRREEEGELINYAYLGTGNFNEKTAKLYCDHALLTRDHRLADEVNQVFDLLNRRILITKNKHLFVSPFNLRLNFERLIDREIERAQKGEEAYMILKMNSLEDQGMIQKLYEANEAGVNMRLIVRGICSLVPGVDGLSEKIEVTSIVDRFLEHARVYIFGNGGKEIMYTASADWMTRNLDNRVEVAIPIYDKKIYKELRQIIDIQLSDNQKARKINAPQTNPYKRGEEGDPPIRAQIKIYEFLQNKLDVTESQEAAQTSVEKESQEENS